MLSKIKKEYAFFCSHSHSMRVLLLTNFTYALVLPVIELFIGAYIIRNSSDFALVMVFQLAQGTGIPIGFLVNGLLQGKLPIARMYSLGMLLSGISMMMMMFLPEVTALGVSLAGFVMGFSYGLFWANRTFLTLTSTRNENRNYYFGMETFLNTVSSIIVPFCAGAFIGASKKFNWFGDNTNAAYYVLTGVVFLLTILASVLVSRGNFQQPPKAPFLFLKFHRLWYKMLRLAVLKGVAQGYIMTAPVMLILKLVGQEGALGSIQSVGALLSAMLLYLLGRKTNPKHRLAIYSAGLSLFLFGALTNAIAYTALGAIIFVACLVFARPLLDLAYFPIQLGVIDFMMKKEKRSAFAFLFNHELGIYVGRMFGCSLFLGLARFISEDVALRYALLVIAGAQFFARFVAKSIMNDQAWNEPAETDLGAVEVLKKPVQV